MIFMNDKIKERVLEYTTNRRWYLNGNIQETNHTLRMVVYPKIDMEYVVEAKENKNGISIKVIKQKDLQKPAKIFLDTVYADLLNKYNNSDSVTNHASNEDFIFFDTRDLRKINMTGRDLLKCLDELKKVGRIGISQTRYGTGIYKPLQF